MIWSSFIKKVLIIKDCKSDALNIRTIDLSALWHVDYCTLNRDISEVIIVKKDFIF